MVSVIIPVYNVEEYLTRALDSVLNSTYKDIEVICVNDGSTDDSLAVLQRYEEIDSRIKVINQKNAGVSAARNVGLAVSSGDYVTFVDADDWIHPQFIEALMSALESEKTGIAVCQMNVTGEFNNAYESIDMDLLPVKTVPVSEGFNDTYIKRRVCGYLYSKDIIKGIKFEPGLKYGEDALFNLDMATSQKEIKIAVVEKALYYYYVRETSAVHVLPAGEILSNAKAYYSRLDTIREQDSAHRYLDAAIKTALACRYLGMFDRDIKKLRKECDQFLRQCFKRREFRDFTLKNKIAFRVFFAFPGAYRVFRIIDDPSMRDWEKKKKAANR